MNYLDRNNIASARIASKDGNGGLQVDLGMTDSQYEVRHVYSVDKNEAEFRVVMRINPVCRLYPDVGQFLPRMERTAHRGHAHLQASPIKSVLEQVWQARHLSTIGHDRMGHHLCRDCWSPYLRRLDSYSILPWLCRSGIFPRLSLLSQLLVHAQGTSIPYSRSLFGLINLRRFLGSDCCRYHQRNGWPAWPDRMALAVHH